MSSSILVINAAGRETRVALVENGHIAEFYLERKKDKGVVGNIYKGRVVRVLPGMQAAFVDIGLEKAAFLYVSDVFYDPDFSRAQFELTEGEHDEAPEVPELSEDSIPGAHPSDMHPSDGDSGADSSLSHEASPHEAFSEEHVASATEAPEGSGVAGGSEEREQPLALERTITGEYAVFEASPHSSPLPPPLPSARSENLSSPEKSATSTSALAESAAESVTHEIVPPVSPPSSATVSLVAAEPMQEATTASPAEGQLPPGASVSLEAAVTIPFVEAVAVIEEPPAPPTPDAHNKHAEERGERRAPRDHHARDKHRRDRDHRNGKGHGHRDEERARKPARIEDLLKVGQEVLVQISKDPIGTKGARLTCHISIPGRHLVFMPTVDHVGISRRIYNEKERRRLREIVDRMRPPGTGFIVRTVAENVPSEKLESDIRFLIEVWNETVRRNEKGGGPGLLHPDLDLILRATRDLFAQDVEKLVVDDREEYERIQSFVTAQDPGLAHRVVLHENDEPVFDAYGIEQELNRATQRKVWLKSGGYLIIDQAEALTAIDVNSGRYVGKKSLEETITKINVEAAREIVYQLRLRNIGGIIICDFIDMEKQGNRDKVFKTLQEALGRDKAKTNVLRISELGLVEMTRKRVRESIGRMLHEDCSYCDGKGFVKTATTVCYEIFRDIRREGAAYKEPTIVINCHSEVAKLLQGDERQELRHLMDRFNKSIQVKAQQNYHLEQYDIYGRVHSQESRPSENRSSQEARRENQNGEGGGRADRNHQGERNERERNHRGDRNNRGHRDDNGERTNRGERNNRGDRNRNGPGRERNDTADRARRSRPERGEGAGRSTNSSASSEPAAAAEIEREEQRAAEGRNTTLPELLATPSPEAPTPAPVDAELETAVSKG